MSSDAFATHIPHRPFPLMWKWAILSEYWYEGKNPILIYFVFKPIEFFFASNMLHFGDSCVYINKMF